MSSRTRKIRFAVAAVGFVSALVLPPWVPLVCILILGFLAASGEALFLGVWTDLLWYAPALNIHGLPVYTIFAIVIIWGLAPLRAEFLR